MQVTRLGGALRLSERALELAQALEADREQAIATLRLSMTYAAIGDISTAIVLGERASDTAVRAEDHDISDRVSSLLGQLYALAGDVEAALRMLAVAAAQSKKGAEHQRELFSRISHKEQAQYIDLMDRRIATATAFRDRYKSLGVDITPEDSAGPL